MKKLLLLASLVSVGFSATAQDLNKEENDKVKSAVMGYVESNKSALSDKASPDSAIWKFPGSIGVNGSLTTYNPYSSDGVGQLLAANAFVKLNANYYRSVNTWKNALNLSFGGTYSSERDNDPKWRKTVDEIILSSKYGYKLCRAAFLSARGAMETQFARTHDFDKIKEYYKDETYAFAYSEKDKNDSTTVKSKLGNPLYVKASLGLDVIPFQKEDFSIFLSPITGKFTWCEDDYVAVNYSMKLNDNPNDGNIYADTRIEPGALIRLEYKKRFNDRVQIDLSNETFVSYTKSVQRTANSVIASDKYQEIEKGVYWEVERDAEGKYIPKYKVEGLLAEYNGFYSVFRFNAIFSLTKYFKLSFNSQLKYDNSEVAYSRDIIQQDKDGVTRTPKASNDYGFRTPRWQFWQSTSIGLTYTFNQ